MQGPDEAPDDTDTVIVARARGRARGRSRRGCSATDVPVDVLRAFDGQLVGGLAFGAGKDRDAYVQGWTEHQPIGALAGAPARACGLRRGDRLHAEKDSIGNTFVVKVGGKAVDRQGG